MDIRELVKGVLSLFVDLNNLEFHIYKFFFIKFNLLVKVQQQVLYDKY